MILSHTIYAFRIIHPRFILHRSSNVTSCPIKYISPPRERYRTKHRYPTTPKHEPWLKLSQDIRLPPRDTIHPWQTHGKWAEVSHVVRSQILKGPVAPVRENVPASQLETNGLLHNRGRHKAAWAGVEVERRDREGQREEENGGGGIAVEYVYPFLC